MKSNNVISTLKRVSVSLLHGCGHLVAPRICAVCRCTLEAHEGCICLKCLIDVPRTFIHRQIFTELQQSLGSTLRVGRICSWFDYQRISRFRNLILEGKFRGKPYILKECTLHYLADLEADNFKLTDWADVIVPAPMHWWKRYRRGYNQSQVIAGAVSSATGLPIVDALRATRTHGHQSRLGAEERQLNLDKTFALSKGVDLQNKKVLLVDDIITTGATAHECIKLLKQAGAAEVSLFTLGRTRLG